MLAATARIIAATQYDETRPATQARLRPDLYHRIASVRIELPPLRARLDDIPLLAEAFLARAYPEETPRLAPDAMERLSRHRWPGNVRELEHAVVRAAQAGAPELHAADFVFLDDVREPEATTVATTDRAARVANARLAMQQAGGVQRVAARLLGITTKTLRKLLTGEPFDA